MAAEYSQTQGESIDTGERYRSVGESVQLDHRPIRPVDRISRWTQPGTPWVPLLSAVGATVAYGVGALIAYLLFPAPYTPLQHTMSELGNPALNPSGAGFYRLGAVLGGTLTAVFFLSLGPWRRSGTRLQNRLLTVVQGLGVVVGLGLAAFAVFPDNEGRAHLIVLGTVANGFAASMLLSLFALRRHGHTDLTVAAVLAVATVGLMFRMPGEHWAEWLPAITSQVYVWVLAFHTAGIIGRNIQGSAEQISGPQPIDRRSNRA